MFNSVKSWRDLCGTDIFYVDRAQVRCPGCVCRWRLTPWRRQDKAMIRAGVACGGRFVVQAVPVGRYQVVYCVSVNM